MDSAAFAAIAADGVVLIHLAFVLFVVFGGLLVLYRRWVAWLHLPAATWGVLIELYGWTCPLTPLENRLRQAAGEAGYAGGFIEHYLLPALYPPGLMADTQLVLGLLLLAGNLALYAWIFTRRRSVG